MKKLLLLLVFLLTYIASAQTTFDASSQLAVLVPNDTGTGTILNQLASINSSGNAVNAATTDINVPVFVVIGGAGTTGNAKLASPGSSVQCKFDAAGGTVKHFVVESAATGGRCMDAGATLPTTGWVVGQLQSSPAANSNGLVILSSSTGALPAGTADGKIPIWNNSTKQYEALDPLMQGTQAPGSTTQPNPLVCGGWDYTNGVVRSCAVDPTSKALLALVLQEPLLNISTCNDCTAGTPAKGDLITPDTNSKWARLAQTLGSAFLNVNQTTLAVPSAPTLTAGNGDGTYAQNTVVFVRITFVGPSTVCATAPCETTGSTETSITLSAGNGCTTNCSAHVPIPSLVGNATGVSVYAWSVAGAERQVSGCVNLASGTCIVGSNPTFFGGTIPPLYNTAYSGTVVIPSYGGTTGSFTTSPVVVTQKSPTLTDWITVSGNAITSLPDRLGGVGMFWRGRQSGAASNVAEAMLQWGAGTGSFLAFAYRNGGTDSTFATLSDGPAASGLNRGIFNIGAISASVHNTVHVYLDDPTAWGNGDLCSRANAAIAYGQCVDLSLGCIIHAEALVGAQNCAAPFAPNRPAKLILGQSTITATTKFIGPTNVGGDPSGLIIEGCGIDCTKITTNSGTSDIFDTGPVGAGLVNMQIRNLSIYSNVTRTAGCGISLTNGGAVENVKIVQTFNGICMNTNGSGGSVKNTQLNCTGALGGNWNSGLAIGGLTAGNFVSNPFFEYVLVSGCASFATALVDINSGADTPMFVGIEAVQNGTSNTAIQIRNSIGGGIAPRWVQFNGGDAEGGTASNGFEVTACNSCSVNSMSIQTSLIGLHINGTGVTGFSFVGGRINNIQQNAVKWDAGTGLDVSHSKLFDTGLAANNTYPIINVAAGMSNGKFAFNDTTSPVPQANKASTGLTIAAGASDDIKVIGNTFTNVVATGSGIISNGGTGINQSFRDNTPEAINDDPFGGDFFTLTDEFQQNAVGAAAKTSTIGQLGWITTAITGCTGSVVQASSWPNLGIIQLQPVNVSGDGCSFTLGDANGAILGALGSNTTWEMVWIFKLTTTASITAKIGFGDVLTALTTTSHGMWLRDDTTVPDNAFKVCVATGAAETCDATTYTADTNFHKLRLFSTTVGTWQVQFDANTARTFCASGCNTTVTVPTTAVFPIAQPITRAAAVNGMNIDFFSFKARGLTTSGRGN